MSLTDNGYVQIERLREETETDHRAVEASLSFMSDELRLEEYLTALQRLHGVVSAWELLAETVSSTELRIMLETRARRFLLEDDIRALQGQVPAGTAPLPQFRSRAEFLGALYVMEGSRLGGQFIARHVSAVLGLKDGIGTSYFRGFGEKTGSNWKELLRILESEISESDTGSTIAGARAMFQAFGTWMNSMALPASSEPLYRPGEVFNV